MPCPLLLIRPHLSLDSLQKVGLLARPAGGAVEKNGQLVTPVTMVIEADVHIGPNNRCSSKNIHFVSLHLGMFMLGKNIPTCK